MPTLLFMGTGAQVPLEQVCLFSFFIFFILKLIRFLKKIFFGINKKKRKRYPKKFFLYNFFSSLSTSGLYKLASITPVIPPSTKVIYARNWFKEDTNPLTSEPKYDKMIFGKINPLIIVSTNFTT